MASSLFAHRRIRPCPLGTRASLQEHLWGPYRLWFTAARPNLEGRSFFFALMFSAPTTRPIMGSEVARVEDGARDTVESILPTPQ
jgi:hypothetical protein